MCLGCQQLSLSQPILTTIIRIPGRRRNVSDIADMFLKSYHAVLDNGDIGFLTSSALQFFPPAVESRDESPNIRNPWAVSSAKQRPGDTIKHPLSFKRSCTRTKRGGNTRGKMVFLLWKKKYRDCFHIEVSCLPGHSLPGCRDSFQRQVRNVRLCVAVRSKTKLPSTSGSVEALVTSCKYT